MNQQPQIGWMADFGIDKHHPLPPRIGQVLISSVSSKGKQITLSERNQFSGYRQVVPAVEVHPTREACVKSIQSRCLARAKWLREMAEDFENAVKL